MAPHEFTGLSQGGRRSDIEEGSFDAMDQNLRPDAVTLTKTLCGHLAGTRFGDLSRRP